MTINRWMTRVRLLSLLGGMALGLSLGQPAGGESIVGGMVQDRIDRTGRYLGAGWGDGYHTCKGSCCRPGSDIPPVDARTIARRKNFHKKMETFYDRFDAAETIHPKDYYVHKRSRKPCLAGVASHGARCDTVTVGHHPVHASHGIEVPQIEEREIHSMDDHEPTITSPSDIQQEAQHRKAQHRKVQRRKLAAKPIRIVATKTPQQAMEPSPQRLPVVKPIRLPQLARPSISDLDRPQRLPPTKSKDRVATQSSWQPASVHNNPFVR